MNTIKDFYNRLSVCEFPEEIKDLYNKAVLWSIHLKGKEAKEFINRFHYECESMKSMLTRYNPIHNKTINYGDIRG